MIKTVLNIEGMNCGHCVKAVNNSICELAGVSNVNVDLESKTASFEYDEAQISIDKIKEEIIDAGYEVRD